MPLPATRDGMSHVGGAGGQGSYRAGRPDAPLRGLLRSRQFAHRAVRSPHLHRVQCPDVPALPQTAAALPASAPHDRGARQCPLSSCRAAEAIPAPAREEAAAAVPAALQPPARLHRASLEAGSTLGYSQSILPHVRGGDQSGQRLLRSLAPAERGAEKAMLHYLRRCV